MCTLLKVANRRPINLISPFFVHEKQITYVGSTGDNSVELARFCCTVRFFYVLSAFFMRFPHFGTFAIHAVPRPRWSSPATQCNVSATRCGRGPRELRFICPPLPYALKQLHAARVTANGHNAQQPGQVPLDERRGQKSRQCTPICIAQSCRRSSPNQCITQLRERARITIHHRQM